MRENQVANACGRATVPAAIATCPCLLKRKWILHPLPNLALARPLANQMPRETGTPHNKAVLYIVYLRSKCYPQLIIILRKPPPGLFKLIIKDSMLHRSPAIRPPESTRKNSSLIDEVRPYPCIELDMSRL